MVASVTHATNGIGTESGDGAVSKTAWEEAHTVSGVALASHAHAGSDITSGTVADARIDSAIARDSEVSGAISTHAGIATAHGTFAAASHTHTAGDLPDLDSLTVPSADVSMNTHKITGLAAPGSNQDAATKEYVDDSVAAGVSFVTPAVVLGTAAAAGAASSTIRSDSTIVAFDATTPAAVGTAAVGAAAVAARRDHVHATGAGTPSTQAFGDAAAAGTGPAAAMTDHKHAMPANPAASGTSMPGSPSAGQRIFRTDLGLECYYDGTRWLTVNEYTVPIAYQDTIAPNSANGTAAYCALDNGTYDNWIVRIVCSTNVLTTNDGTKFWTVAFNRKPSPTSLGSFNTSADTAGTSARHVVTVGALSGTSDRFVDISVTKTSTPGNIYVFASLVYRLVVT